MTIEDYEKVLDLWENTDGIGLSDADSKEAIFIIWQLIYTMEYFL